MSRLRRHFSQHRHFAAVILALALALRVLVPAGYMPAFEHGAVEVRICESQVTLPMPRGMHHGADHGRGQNHADQPCAFAGLAAPAGPPPPAAALPAAPAGAQVAFLDAVRNTIIVGGIRSRPPARGPPAPA